jgi:hypothetical protein
MLRFCNNSSFLYEAQKPKKNYLFYLNYESDILKCKNQVTPKKS